MKLQRILEAYRTALAAMEYLKSAHAHELLQKCPKLEVIRSLRDQQGLMKEALASLVRLTTLSDAALERIGDDVLDEFSIRTFALAKDVEGRWRALRERIDESSTASDH